MADKRPWAKIDTGYILNPKWFQIERSIQNAMQNAEHTAMQNAKRASMQAHLASVLYCARNQTDGVFPVRAIKAELDLYGEPEEAAITALFDAGLWINLKGGMAEVRDYLEHQTPAEHIKETSSKRSEAARVGWEKRRAANANSNAEEKRREEKEVARADVLEILDYLDSKLLTLEVKLPNRNKTNLQEARRLLDVDHKTVTQVKACIDYAMDDPFWSTTCLSIKSLRKSYDRISLQARGKQNTRQAVPALVRAGDLDD